MNGRTVAGETLGKRFALNKPTSVILDADDNLFIVDSGNQRIIRLGSDGFRCLIGCSKSSCSRPNEVCHPLTAAFDSYGNIFITNEYMNGIQKFLLSTNSCASSVNKPKLNECASWSSNPIIIANSTTTDMSPFSLFIGINDTLYVADRTMKTIHIYPEKSGDSTKTIVSNFTFSTGFFVTITGDIYIDNGNNSHISKWSFDTISNDIIMYMNSECISLFIHIDNTLYCSIQNGHQVVKMSLNSNDSTFMTAAGTGCAGSTSDMLDQPFGIYVNINFDLYVADTGNNRVQLFYDGEMNGRTVAGETLGKRFALNKPTSVILDADDNLFIVDSGNQRIIRLGSDGFRCLMGCSKSSCSRPNEVCHPLTAAFDSYGNIFIANQYINGIQKFLLATNSCDETSIMPEETSTEINKEETTSQYIQSTIQTTIDKTTTTTQSTTSSIIGKTCSRPLIALFPSPSSLESPLQFRRSQDFYISATLTLNCAESLDIERRWSVFECTPNCSIEAKIDSSIKLILNELFIPARTLSYGVYELKITVTMTASSNLISSESSFVKINPSGITANLVQFGTSLITSSYEEDLILNPGNFSINPDETTFNASDWTYQYRCRLYNTINMGTDTYIYDNTSSCFSNQADVSAWRYKPMNDSQSSVRIQARSLEYNRIYQFSVFMINRRNITSQATGYVLVDVENTRTPIIAVACVISTMCSPNLQYQYINPSTQIALFSVCTGNCRPISNIHWNIYEGSNDSLVAAIVEWTQFNHMNSSRDLHFLGVNTTNFTAINTLFTKNPNISYWRFEVVYSFYNETSSSALDFMINQPPENGSCSIDPQNGTTTTLFTVNCTDWFDKDNISDYSFYLWYEKSSELVMLAFTTSSTLQIRLPPSDDNTSTLNLTVHIRDTLNGVREFYLEERIVVILNESSINTFIDSIQNTNNNDPIVQALASGNQHIIAQVTTIFSQELNKRNKKNLETAIANGIPAAKISVSPLGSNRRSEILASQKCYELARTLKAIAMRVSYEDAQYASTRISYCINNVLTAINAPLQQRGFILNAESIYEDSTVDDYETDLELMELNLNLLTNQDDFSREILKENRIRYNQKKTAHEIGKQANATFALITTILKIHLNIGQNMSMNSTSLLINIETTTIESLSNKIVKQVGQAQIHIPSNFESNIPKNTTISLRSTMHSLAPAGASQSSANTNMSTAISLSLLDISGKEVSIHASDKQPIEFFIPRDPNFILPKRILQNVTSKSNEELFYLTVIHTNEFITNNNLTMSVHFEIRPLDRSLGYIFIYKFDGTPYLNSSKKNIDGWSLFCPLNLTEDGIYKYFIDNRKISYHKLIVFGLRELNSTEIDNFCQNTSISNSPPIIDEPLNFTSDYELRIYTSGCYYLDEYNNWQSNGLWVGPLTDYNKTQCFSTHLTTFASSFQVLFLSIHTNEFNLKRYLTQFNQLEWFTRHKFFSHEEYIFKQIDQPRNDTTHNKEFDPFQLSFYQMCSNLELQ
ncbi:unnamed protein product [Rotaria sordida]|uniref:PKD/REJ-like domain-containing protein n=1 Tax=Rotaria sordida TaxID=392033 RepID=A0A814HUR3_9BILA|nr:unnamed protein product [Rotaria sordida]